MTRIPATRAIGGMTYGKTVRNSIRGRTFGTRRCTHSVVGSSSSWVNSTVRNASFRLSTTVVRN